MPKGPEQGSGLVLKQIMRSFKLIKVQNRSTCCILTLSTQKETLVRSVRVLQHNQKQFMVFMKHLWLNVSRRTHFGLNFVHSHSTQNVQRKTHRRGLSWVGGWTCCKVSASVNENQRELFLTLSAHYLHTTCIKKNMNCKVMNLNRNKSYS